MKIRIHPSLILWLSVLFYVNHSIMLPFLGAALFHELGHLLALAMMDRLPSQIELTFSGARMDIPAMGYRQELLASAAGPAASLILGTGILLWPQLGLMSLVLGAFNLLPVPGLDGGSILRCLTLLYLSPDQAAALCRLLGILTALMIWTGALYLSLSKGFGLWPMAIAALFLYKALSMDNI